MRRYEAERTLLLNEGRAVHGVCDDDFRFENPGIKLREREGHTVSVLRLGNHIGGHGAASKLLALRYSGLVEEFFEKHTFVRFLLLIVRIHDRESFPRHLFQISDGENERSGDSAADSEFRRSRGGLRRSFRRRV